VNEWAILKSELDVLMIYEEEAEAVAQVMYKCNFPSEVERWVWVGDSLLKQLPFGVGGEPVPGWGQFDGQDQQGQQGQQGQEWEHYSQRADAQLQEGLQQQQQNNAFTNQQPQGVQTRMTPSLASRLNPFGTRTEAQGPNWETGPGTQRFHQTNVKRGHGPQEYHDWVNEQYGEPQPGVGQRMGAALGRFGTWAGDKAKGAWGGAKKLGAKAARGFEGAGTYIDEMAGSMGRGLTGVKGAFGNAREKAGQTMSDRAQIQGGHATAEEIQQERDRDRRKELEGQQKTLADQIAAIGGGHGTGAGAPRGVPQPPGVAPRLPELPAPGVAPAPLLDNLGGPIVPPPGAEQQPPAPAPEVAPTPAPAETTPPQIVPPAEVNTTPPQIVPPAGAPVGFSETEWGNLNPGVQRAWDKVDPEAQQEIYDAMRRGEWDEDKGGAKWWRKGRWGSGRDAMEGLDQTTPAGQIVPPGDDDGSWNNQGADYGLQADNLRGKIVPPAKDASQQKLTSSDSFTHAWDYLLKGL